MWYLSLSVISWKPRANNSVDNWGLGASSWVCMRARLLTASLCVYLQRGPAPSPFWRAPTRLTPQWTTEAPHRSSAKSGATSNQSSSGWSVWSITRRAATTPPLRWATTDSWCFPPGRCGRDPTAPTSTSCSSPEPRRRTRGCTSAWVPTPWATASAAPSSPSCQVRPLQLRCKHR